MMMTIYFCIVDLCRRNTNLFSSQLGQFVVSGGGATFGFFLVWPLEVLKNLSQAETKGMGNTTMERAKFIMRT